MNVTTNRKPNPLTKEEAASLTAEAAAAVRRLDCNLYRECLDVAVEGDWPGFGCNSCQAYQAMDMDQKALDWMALTAVREAAENVDRTTTVVQKDGRTVVRIGKADRRRGVKPGADAKTRVRLRVLQGGSPTPEETVQVTVNDDGMLVPVQE